MAKKERKPPREVATVEQLHKTLEILATAAVQRSEPERYLYLVETLPELHRRELEPLWLELVAMQEAESELVKRILERTGDYDAFADAERMLMDYKAAGRVQDATNGGGQ